MSNVKEKARLLSEAAKLTAEIQQAQNDKAYAEQIIADDGKAQAAAILENREYTAPQLPDIAALDSLIARNRAALSVINAKIAELQKEIDADNRAAKGKLDAKRARFIAQYREPNSHLFKFDKVADLTIREIIELLATQAIMTGDPRVAVQFQVGRIPADDWIAAKKRAIELLEAQQ